ncbi:MAG: hypothetical protein QGF67_08150 [Lentisphaeria bacterium]|nr:hypothetical protein [Lentisphaeria bacterium]MDP7741396.1 hypothetical protein [Lentisphaeria bacterium]
MNPGLFQLLPDRSHRFSVECFRLYRDSKIPRHQRPGIGQQLIGRGSKRNQLRFVKNRRAYNEPVFLIRGDLLVV